MSSNRIIVSARGATPRLCLLEDEQPVALRFFPEAGRPFAGEILTARVVRVAGEINAAFLLSDAGELLLPYAKAKGAKKARAKASGKKLRSIADCVHEGESVTVQVVREADPGDAKLAVARLYSGAGRDSGPSGLAGLIAHMASDHKAEIIIDERKLYLAVKRLAGEGKDAGEVTLWTDQGAAGQRNIFEQFGVAEVIDEVAKGRVPLATGGALHIDQTRALTAIDVDTGAADRGRDAARTALTTNIAAAEKIGWALRFLDIGGLVVIDFVGMKTKADREAVLEALDKALAGDPATTERSGFSRFGLVELARQKSGPSALGRLAAQQRAAKS